jgi:hypothetical protein
LGIGHNTPSKTPNDQVPDEARIVDGLATKKKWQNAPRTNLPGRKSRLLCLTPYTICFWRSTGCHLDINLKRLLTGARSIACGMAYRKFSWLADRGRVTIALAIPMATRHFYMLGSVHVPVSKHIRAAAGGPSA